MQIRNISYLLIPLCALVSCKPSTSKYRATIDIWSQNYLSKNNDEVRSILSQYNANNLCADLKSLRGNQFKHDEIKHYLHKNNYSCNSAALKYTPDPLDPRFLLKNGSFTHDVSSPDIVYQEIWSKNQCAMRIKLHGFPNQKRPQPHLTKAVLIIPNDTSYDNEAFKIDEHGEATPKGPLQESGLDLSNYNLGENEQTHLIDQVMSSAHADLLEPSSRACD